MMTEDEAMDNLNAYVSKLEDETMQNIADYDSRVHALVPNQAENDNKEWLRRYPRIVTMDRDEHLHLFQQHPDFIRDNALWVIAGIEVASFIGMAWCCSANLWCALATAFFISTALFGLWAWERVEEAA